MSDCRIEWGAYTAEEWDGLYSKISKPTLLQSFPYAQAMRHVHQQGVRHGVITVDGKQAGIVQIQDVGLFGKLIHGLSLDRGPLWFDGFDKPTHMKAFAKAFNSEFPKRTGRKRRFIPEWSGHRNILDDTGWNFQHKQQPYQTHLVDLSADLDDMRRNLKQKWRNILNRAEKQNLNIEEDWDGQTLTLLLKNYMQDRLQKRYAGASPKFLSALAQYTLPRKECLILNATEDNECIASVLLFLHGKGATYQVGWTTPYGRDKGAHHLLLWEAMKILKSRDITTFDTGGFNDDTPGIKQFKDGLGGHAIALIGSYS